MSAEYRNKSENTVDQLSLHDCMCSRVYQNDNKLIFNMEWMEVLPDHPDNPFGEAHQSGEGCIILHGADIRNGTLIGDEGEIPLPERLDAREMEILSFDETSSNGEFELDVYAELHEPHRQYDFISFTVHYISSEVMFDELGQASWFEKGQ